MCLVLLFVKYVSDKYEGKDDALIIIPKGGSFRDMVALKGQKDIGEGINTIITNLAQANDLKGVIDVADFDNDDKLGKGKDKQDRLSNLVSIFEHPSLNFSKNRAEGDDILGDAYEYLCAILPRNQVRVRGNSIHQPKYHVLWLRL
jgi:type I restriction enzyme M protein